MPTQLRLTRVSRWQMLPWLFPVLERHAYSGAIHVVRIRGDGREADAAPPLE